MWLCGWLQHVGRGASPSSPNSGERQVNALAGPAPVYYGNPLLESSVAACTAARGLSEICKCAVARQGVLYPVATRRLNSRPAEPFSSKKHIY